MNLTRQSKLIVTESRLSNFSDCEAANRFAIAAGTGNQNIQEKEI
jgi:hypothetical protein